MTTDAPVIRTEGLVKTFGKVRALDGLDLEVAPGEVHGFLGPNGAGKSTTIRVLLGLMRADGGSAELFGHDPWRKAAQLHERLAYVPGDVALWPGLTGGQCLDIFGATHGGVDERRRAELIERFDLDPTKRARDYSKGNRQKVALVAGPRDDRRAPRPRRTDERPGPPHGAGLPGGRPRAARRGRHRPAVQPHPRRGRGPRRPGDDHPQGPPGPDRHPRRPAAAYPHHSPCGHRGAGRRARRRPRRHRLRRRTARRPRRRAVHHRTCPPRRRHRPAARAPGSIP